MTKATRLARAKARTETDAPAQPGTFPDPPSDTREQRAIRGIQYEELLHDLRVLATREDGWLRLIPDTDRQQVHLKWKFTRGKWERHYVWVTIEDMRVHYGLQLLLRKLYEVDTGEHKPTMDKLYGEDS